MSQKSVVLLIDDNEKLLVANERIFTNVGYIVLTAKSLAEAREHINEERIDVIVLDIMLPDGSGLDFISEIRETTNAPILLVTSLGTKDDRLAGLRAGGDDYIAKPYDFEELTERVAAFLRREAMHKETLPDEIKKGPLTLDIVSGIAFLNGEDMKLAPKEFSILLILVQNQGKALPAEKLYEEIWKQPMTGDDHSIRNAVYRLRKKLETGEPGKAGEGGFFSIEVSRLEGYRFEHH